jgi:hypothetical protein
VTTHQIALLLTVDADPELSAADVAGIIVAELPNWGFGGYDPPSVMVRGATVDLGGTGSHLAGSITESWRNRSRLDT